MATLTITTRRAKSGKRYVVRFRRGGSEFPIEHGGSFKTKREAQIRRDVIGGELAAGRDPRDVLHVRVVPATTTFREWGDRFVASRLDVSSGTLNNYRIHLKVLNEVFGDRIPNEITPDDAMSWITSSDLKPSSLRQYMGTLRQVLDHARVEPNAARDRRVRLPRIETEEINPPTAKQFLAILAAIPEGRRLPFLLQEQTGMRSTEIATLTWGDLDFADSQLRVSRARSKTRTGRWVQVPAWLMERIAETLSAEDRTADRRVFPGLSKDVLKSAMSRACVVAGTGSFSPHDLRHRWISLRVGKGVPITTITAQTGHARKSVTLDVYAHVLIDPAEINEAEVLALL